MFIMAAKLRLAVVRLKILMFLIFADRSPSRKFEVEVKILPRRSDLREAPCSSAIATQLLKKCTHNLATTQIPWEEDGHVLLEEPLPQQHSQLTEREER